MYPGVHQILWYSVQSELFPHKISGVEYNLIIPLKNEVTLAVHHPWPWENFRHQILSEHTFQKYPKKMYIASIAGWLSSETQIKCKKFRKSVALDVMSVVLKYFVAHCKRSCINCLKKLQKKLYRLKNLQI